LPSLIKNATLDIDSSVVYTELEQMRIRSKFPAHLTYIGLVTGKRYEWEKAGEIVLVNSEDVPELLSKVIGGAGCCGAVSNGNVVFEIV
jgi:hypothetical protein